MASCSILWGSNRTSLVAQMVKNPPAMQETWVWSLGREVPLEKGTATHFSCLENPWTEEPGRLQSIGSLGHDWATKVNWTWFLASHICSVPSCPLGNYFRQLHSPTAPTSPKTYSPEQCRLLDHSFPDQLSIMAFLSSIERCYSWAPQWGMELSVPRRPLSCHRSLSSYSIKLANIKVHWCVCAHVPSCFSYVQLFVTPRAVARHASLSRQEYWSG